MFHASFNWLFSMNSDTVNDEPPNLEKFDVNTDSVSNQLPSTSGEPSFNSNLDSPPNIASKMSTKQRRVPPMWPLSKEETITSFDSWKGNFLYTLNLDENFAPFLDPTKTWDKKTKGGRAHRGLDSAQELNFLELMLGQICNFCPVISRNTIIKNSTSIDSVWQMI